MFYNLNENSCQIFTNSVLHLFLNEYELYLKL